MKKTMTRMRPEVKTFLGLGPIAEQTVADLVPAASQEFQTLRRVVRDTPLTTLRRSGQFRAWLHPENQCGHEGQDTFNFFVEATVAVLDDRGFVYDNYETDVLFAPLAEKMHDGSCEQLCGYLITRLAEHVGPRIVAIRAIITPNDRSEIEMNWHAGQTLPANIAAVSSKKARRANPFRGC